MRGEFDARRARACPFSRSGRHAHWRSPCARTNVKTDSDEVCPETDRPVGEPPCPLARSAAMMPVAMYDAPQAIDRRYTPLILRDASAAPGANRKAASAAAADAVMVHLY